MTDTSHLNISKTPKKSLELNTANDNSDSNSNVGSPPIKLLNTRTKRELLVSFRHPTIDDAKEVYELLEPYKCVGNNTRYT